MFRNTQPRRTRSALLGIERLEGREVPAGNVAVLVSNGVVSVFGDAQNNQVAIQQNAVGDLFVLGVNGTTVNGRAALYLGRFSPAAVTVNLGAGNDTFQMNGVVAEQIAVNGGAGADSIALVNTVSSGDITVNGGAGNDAVFVANVFAEGTLTLDGGTGIDSRHIQNINWLTAEVLQNFERRF